MASQCLCLCAKCLRIKPKEAHHVFPREFFGDQPNGPFILLCQRCHKELDKIVHYRSLTKRQILDITAEWLVEE